jgi:phage gp36-like protein
VSYTSLIQLTDRFGEQTLVLLTDRAEVATNAIDTDVIDRALADTDAQIDGYLGNRYTLPLAETPPLIADLAQAIAYYKLHVYEPNPKIKDDYKDAIATLRDISKGVVTLDVAGVEPDVNDSSGVQITDRERPLTEASMKGFI